MWIFYIDIILYTLQHRLSEKVLKARANNVLASISSSFHLFLSVSLLEVPFPIPVSPALGSRQNRVAAAFSGIVC